jgi:hypothetical protein
MDALGQREATKIMVLFWLAQREALDIDLKFLAGKIWNNFW